jgi:hypothetical protein
LKETHQRLVNAVDINLLEEEMRNIKKNNEL